VPETTQSEDRALFAVDYPFHDKDLGRIVRFMTGYFALMKSRSPALLVLPCAAGYVLFHLLHWTFGDTADPGPKMPLFVALFVCIFMVYFVLRIYMSQKTVLRKMMPMQMRFELFADRFVVRDEADENRWTVRDGEMRAIFESDAMIYLLYERGQDVLIAIPRSAFTAPQVEVLLERFPSADKKLANLKSNLLMLVFISVVSVLAALFVARMP